MTDSDIIKAIKNCINEKSRLCSECPSDSPYAKTLSACRGVLLDRALDVIQHQQAEIEQLKVEKDNLVLNYKEYAMEAVKDFAERIKATFPPRDKCTLDDCYTLDKIDEIVAEMEGEK